MRKQYILKQPRYSIPQPTASPKTPLNRSFADRDEPSWLIGRRREAFARFQAFAWPNPRDEEWRRTDIRALRLTPSHLPTRRARRELGVGFDPLGEVQRDLPPASSTLAGPWLASPTRRNSARRFSST